MIKLSKGKNSNLLAKEILEQEKELNAIKEALEYNNLKALNELNINKNNKKGKKISSARIPQNMRLKEKKEELKKLKEIDELSKIQYNLFKNVNKRKNIIKPISQRVTSSDKKYYKTEDYFAINLNNECDRILGNKNNKNNKTICNKTFTSNWNKKRSLNKVKSIKNNNVIDNKRKTMINMYSNEHKKEMDKIKDIINNTSKTNLLSKDDEATKNNDSNNNITNNLTNDEKEDKKFLDNLNEKLREFYEEKTKEIFEFLKEINLCRYINNFLNSGYDIFEEFIELPLDFFSKKENSFLNEAQRKKLYNKITQYKKSIKIEKIDKSSNLNINNISSLDKIIFCWNCLKPLKQENSIIKKYELNKDKNLLYEYKNFCSEKCVKDFEQKKEICCFECKKFFNFSKNGFIIFDNEKFCGTICKNKYIDNKNKFINDNTNYKEKENDEHENEDKNFEEEYEGDNYDPMNDF